MASGANFALSDFRVAIKATGHEVLLKRVLADCAKALGEVPSIALKERTKAESAVRALLEYLNDSLTKL